METSSIPKNIWQTYVDNNLPTRPAACQQLWLHFHPNYKYSFFTDNNIYNFFEEYFDSIFLDVLNKMPLGVMKADFWRYAILYIYGGVYSDIDSSPEQSIDNLINLHINSDIFIASENENHFCQWTIISAPKHEILNIVLHLIVEKIQQDIDYTSEHFVHDCTGPAIWTQAVSEYFGCESTSTSQHVFEKYFENSKKVCFLPRRAFYGEYVSHWHGSTVFPEPYKSWTKERDEIWKKAAGEQSSS